MTEQAPEQFEPSFFAGIVESSPDPYVVVDHSGTILWASRNGSAIVGRTPDEYVGHSVAEFLAPHSTEAALEAFAEYVSPARADTGWIGPPMPVDLVHRDGHFVPVEIRQVPTAETFDGIVLRVSTDGTMTALYDSIERIVADQPLDVVLESIIRLISVESPYSISVIGRGWDGQRFTHITAAIDAPHIDHDHLPVVPDGRSPWHQRLVTGDSLAEHDLTTIDPDLRAAAQAVGAVACWVLPVPETRDPSARDDVVLVLWRRAPGPPRLNVARRMDRIVGLIGLAVRADEARRQLRQLALTDAVTGLPNRTALSDHFRALGRRPAGRDDGGPSLIGVLYCDLDHFKEVNDRHGHPTGDRVLAIAAERLRSRLRADDVLARVGGDEFVVVSMARDEGSIDALAERLVTAFDEPVTIGDLVVPLGISVGVTTAPAREVPTTVTGDDLIARADIALLDAKRSGKHRVVWSRP